MKKITLLFVVLITITIQAQNKLLSSISQYNSLGTWENSYGTNYKYDSNNNLIEEISLRFNEDGVWENSYKDTYTYNANNKVTEELGYDWNTSNNQFDLKWRSTYLYVNNKLTEWEELNWSSTAWESDEKITITYNNNLPAVLTERYFENEQWYEYRTTFTYNANNKIISSVEEEWVNLQWINSHKALYTYGANNKLITVKRAEWDAFNNIWKANNEIYEYEWDASGNKKQTIDSYDISPGNISQYKTEYTYDTSQLMNSFIHPFRDKTGFDYFDEGFPYVNKILTETYNGGTSRTTYNYNSAITLSTVAYINEVATITVYPNPTHDFLNIQNVSNTTIDKVIITDLSGKKVLEQNNSSKVDVQKLPKGIYVFQALSGKEKYTTKFVKE